MHRAVLDTGFFVALLDKSENNHDRCVTSFKNYKGVLLTTEPVLTEAIYLLGPSIRAQKACIEFMVNGGAILVPQSVASLSRAAVLMEKYKDIPMDFADATIVVLAEEAGIDEVLTLDIRGFSAYRRHGEKAFSIQP